jgi:hypothetical protein
VRGVHRYRGPLRGGVLTLTPRRTEPTPRELRGRAEPASVSYEPVPSHYVPYILPGCTAVITVGPDGSLHSPVDGSPWGCAPVPRVVPRATAPRPRAVAPRPGPAPAPRRAERRPRSGAAVAPLHFRRGRR